MTRTISPFALGYSILAGPILWAVHFIAVYMVTEFGCRANFNNLIYFTPDGIRTFIVVITLIFLSGVAAGGIFAYRSWGLFQANNENGSSEDARVQFLSTMGILLSALFLLSIISTAVPAFFTSACDRVL